MSYKLFLEGRIWHYRFQIGRKRIQKSTRETSRAKADIVAQRAYDDARVRTNGGKPVPTLVELIRGWQAVHTPVISTAHARSVDTFARLHLYDLGAMRINTLTTSHVELARNEHLLTHAPASANHWLRILKLVVNWAVKSEVIVRLPWRVRMLKLQKRPRTILPLDVAAMWFDAVDRGTPKTPGIGIAVRLMLFLGLRASEATSARWEWVDWARSTYTPGVTKGREAEPLRMSSWLADYLKPIRKTEGLIAAKPDGTGFPAGFARDAMIVANDACSTKGITPHRLRGTIATLMSESGVPIQTIQAFLRHKSPLTTMSYLERNNDTVTRAQNDIASKIWNRWRESGGTQESKLTGDGIP